MLDSKPLVHRMVKVNVARAPQYPDTASGSTQPTAVTQTTFVTQTTVVDAANASQSVASPLPTSTAALAGAITFLGLALLLGTFSNRMKSAISKKALQCSAPASIAGANTG